MRNSTSRGYIGSAIMLFILGIILIVVCFSLYKSLPAHDPDPVDGKIAILGIGGGCFIAGGIFCLVQGIHYAKATYVYVQEVKVIGVNVRFKNVYFIVEIDVNGKTQRTEINPHIYLGRLSLYNSEQDIGRRVVVGFDTGRGNWVLLQK